MKGPDMLVGGSVSRRSMARRREARPILRFMERDLRTTPHYQETEAFFRTILEPGLGRASSFGDPEPAPDGRSVAVTGYVLDALEGRPHGRVVLAEIGGEAGRAITHGPNDDVGPRWSPDGDRLTFTSDRRQPGKFQLYELATDRLGEARLVAEVPGVVEHHRWSPDGSRILMVVAGERAEQADALGSGTLGSTAADEPAWLPDVETEDEVGEWRSLWVLDVATGEARTASPEGLNVWEASWLGNDRVVAVVSDAPGEGAWYRARLSVIDPAGGAERVLLRSEVQLGCADGAPDGASVAVLEAVCSDRYVVAGELLLIDASSGEVRRVEAVGDVSSVRWRGTRLFAMALDGLDAVALDVDPAAGAGTEIWRSSEASGSYHPSGAPIGDGRDFVTALSSARRPPRIVLSRNGHEESLAETGHAGREAALGHLGAREAIRWSAPDGTEIEGLLTTPNGDPPFPLLLAVHGGPVGAITDAWPSVATSLLLARGYAILQPNPRGSTGRGRPFAAGVVGDMGGADALDDLAGVDALVAKGIADPDRIGVIGGSYGGFMAAWLPTIDDRFKAAVALSPVTDWYSEHFHSSLIDWVVDFVAGTPDMPGGQHHERSPALAGERLRTPTLLTAGANDRATPAGQAIEHFRALRARGVPAAVVVYPQEGHGVQNLPAGIDLASRITAWFERFMPAR
jgi:dipeptidyl aminopeptidase/acylaminoacyl peptidase